MRYNNPMIRQMLLGATVASTCLTTLHAAPLDVIQEWNFNSDTIFEGWTEFTYSGGEPVRISDLTVAGGVLSGKVDFNDPGLNVGSLSLNSTQAGYVKMRYRVLDGSSSPIIPPSPSADIIVPTPGGSQGGANTAPNSNTVVDPVNGWTEAIWDITDLTGTTITSLRLDPVNTVIDSGNGTFEIDYIQVLETDIQPALSYEVDGAAPGPNYTLVKEWDSDSDWALWTGTNFTIDSIAGGILSGTSTSGDAQLAISEVDFGAAVPAPASGEYLVEYSITSTPSPAGPQQLFWADSNGGIAGARSVTITTPDDTSTHTVRAKLKDLIGGELKYLRFDINNVAAVGTSLDYLRIYVETTEIGWDTNTVTAGAQGGTGVWNTTNPFFFDGFSPTNRTWPYPLADVTRTAIFGGTAGIVTVDTGGITADALNFRTTGYTVTGDAVALEGATSVISGNAGVATTINAPINRSSSTSTNLLNFAGPGTFSIGGGGTIDRKWHFKTDASLTAGTFTSSGAGNASNGLCVYNTSTLTIAGATLDRTNGDADDAFYVGGPATTGDFAGSSRKGTLIVNSGSLTVSGGRGLAIGFRGSNNSEMTVNGGNVTSDILAVGWNSTGILNVSGGTVSVTPGDAAASAVRHTDNGAGTINLTGGDLKTGNVMLGLGNGNTGTVSLTVNLDASATLETDRIWINKGTATGDYTLTCNFDGGTLKLPAVEPTGCTCILLGNIADGGGGITTYITNIENGGLIVDTNGRQTFIDTVLEHDPSLGSTPDGGLTKNGLGNLGLFGQNTYTGNTTVNAGSLEVFEDDVFADTSTVSIPSSGALQLMHSGTDQVASLIIGGVSQGLGSYSFGSGSLEVIGSPAGYTTWAAANAGSQSADLDFDNDGVSNGVEYFMGETGSSFTANPGVVVGTITWPKDPAFAGTFKVQISDTLATGSWTDIVPPDASIDESNPNQIIYTLPTGSPKKFARLSVTVSP